MIFGISFPEVEREVLEERIAILKAVKCPGKTHSLIKSKELRDAFARELNDYRNQRLRGKNSLEAGFRAKWKRRIVRDWKVVSGPCRKTRIEHFFTTVVDVYRGN